MNGGRIDRVASGVAWMLSQSVVGKLVALAGQVLLARLVIPEEWGIFAIAISAAAFVSIIRQGGLAQVLVQRQSTFAEWATAGFWLSACTGWLAALAILAAMPIIVLFSNEPGVAPVLFILALEAPCVALAVVPRAYLRMQMKFRFLACLGCISSLIQHVTAVLLAIFGFGALAFAVPKLVVAVIQLIILWRASRPPIFLRLDFDRWGHLLRDSLPAMTAAAIFVSTQEGDYLIIAMLYDTQTVGLYFFAFMLSSQAVVLLTTNLQVVLFPALSSIENDMTRRADATIKAARVLGFVAIPLCLSISASAEPILGVLGNQWIEAAPVLQVLSFAMAFRTVTSPAGTLIQASGHFKLYMFAHFCSAAVFFAFVIPGAIYGGAVGTSWGVLIHSCFSLWFFYWMAMSLHNKNKRFFFEAILKLFFCASAGALGAQTISIFIFDVSSQAYLAKLAFLVPLSLSIYFVLVRLLASQDLRSSVAIGRRLLHGKGMRVASRS